MKKPTNIRDKMPAELLDYFREEGRRGGKVGGKARAAKLTPAQRSEIARKAGKASAKARWGKKNEAPKKSKK